MTYIIIIIQLDTYSKRFKKTYIKDSKITEVDLFAFIHRLFDENFSPIVGTNMQ